MAALCAAGMLALNASPAAAAADAAYEHVVELNVDGSAALTAVLHLPAGTHAPLSIVVERGAPEQIGLDGVEGATASVRTEAGRTRIVIAFAGDLPQAATLRVSARLRGFLPEMTAAPGAHGDRTLRYAVTNLEATAADVRGEIVLPPGYVVTSIEDSNPPVRESSTELPYSLTERDGRRAVEISSTNVPLGSSCSIAFRFKERKPSLLLLIGLAALGACYLVAFRSLVRA